MLVEAGHTGAAGHRAAPGAALSVAVFATDRITRDGVEGYLRACEGLLVLDGEEEDRGDADVLVVLANRVTDEVLDVMARASRAFRRPSQGIVLVAGDIAPPQLARALDHGLVRFLVRGRTSMEHIGHAVHESRYGQVALPRPHVQAMMRHVRSAGGADAAGLGAAEGGGEGLGAREVAVLRLVAEGMDTAETARALGVSERAVKHVLAGMMSRLGLRNRSHAISWAIQHGAI